MKIALFSPYIPDHQGGGERYLLDCARMLTEDHAVSVCISRHRCQLSHDQQSLLPEFEHRVRAQYQSFMGDPLTNINWLPTPLGSSSPWWQKWWWTKQWDILIYLTDGSLFPSLAKKSILHIQFPLRLNKKSWWEQLKLRTWSIKNTNSNFTRQIIEPTWPVKIDLVHYPMIDPPSAVNQNKQRIILHVGRFFKHLHTKRQDVLVNIFQNLLTSHPQLMADWKLIMIGTVENGAEHQIYADQIKKAAQGWPIEIYHQISHQQLWDWYGRASIYWHATGYGIDPQVEPEKVEHFGISTAEAMSQAAVPVVIGLGGQLEVVGSQLANWTWLIQDECLTKTAQLIADGQLRKKLGQVAQQQSQQFSKQQFTDRLRSMIGNSQ